MFTRHPSSLEYDNQYAASLTNSRHSNQRLPALSCHPSRHKAREPRPSYQIAGRSGPADWAWVGPYSRIRIEIGTNRFESRRLIRT